MLFILPIVETIFLLFGLFLPLVEINEFWVFKNEISLFLLILTLFETGDITLGSIVCIFGVVIPLIKITSRFVPMKLLEVVPLHKFAMVDIFLISFLIFIGQASAWVQVDISLGFYFLLISILLGYVQTISQFIKTS